MNQQSIPAASDATALFVDVPLRLFTAIRTHRFYPPANPQVQLSRNLFLKAINELRKASQNHQDVEVALASKVILVCGARLNERDSARQQIQGLSSFFTQFNIHSIIFHDTFNEQDSAVFLHLLADLMGRRELEVPVTTLIEQARLTSVSIDTKRYVEIHGRGGTGPSEDTASNVSTPANGSTTWCRTGAPRSARYSLPSSFHLPQDLRERSALARQ